MKCVCSLFLLCNLIQQVIPSFLSSPLLPDGLNITKNIQGVDTVVIDFEKSDPDEGLTIPQIIESRGFNYQMHTVITRDGYILQHYRIVNPRIGIIFKRPVVCVHGLFLSGSQFIPHPGGHIDEILPGGVVGNNLGFELAKRGYDVWLFNVRGCEYSRGHTHYHTYSRDFWDHTKDDMIEFDLPDTLDYIQAVTNSSKLAYIGYSQGTNIMFGLLSREARFNDIIEPFIAFAPVGTDRYVEPLVALLSALPLNDQVLAESRYILTPKFIQVDFAQFCKSIRSYLCNALFVVAFNNGVDPHQVNVSRIPVFLSSLGFGTSAKNIELYGQNMRSGRFQKFDYGSVLNSKLYGSSTPPEYDLTKITNRNIALISSTQDQFANQIDITYLREVLGDSIIFDHIVPAPGFSHLDFAYSMNVGTLVNSKVIQVLEMYIGSMRSG